MVMGCQDCTEEWDSWSIALRDQYGSDESIYSLPTSQHTDYSNIMFMVSSGLT